MVEKPNRPHEEIDPTAGAYRDRNVATGHDPLAGREQPVHAAEAGDDLITAQVAEGASHVVVGQNILQIGALKIPRYLAILIACALGVLAAISLVNVYFTSSTAQRTRSVADLLRATPTATLLPSPTPLAFATAAPEETLILLATFYNTAQVNTEPQVKIRRRIEEELRQLDARTLRVAVEPSVLRADQQAEAQALGERYHASMVIWGEDTGVEVFVQYLNLRATEFGSSEAQIQEQGRTQLSNPNAYGQFITADLPNQLAFLALFAVGQSYLAAEADEEAIVAIEQALAQLPAGTQFSGQADAYFTLGWLYQEPTINDVAQAIANYEQALALDPNNLEAYNNRGLAYADQGQYALAIADYDQAIALDPTYPEAYNNRGLAYADQGKDALAIQDYTQALALDATYLDAYINRGISYYQQGEDVLARQDFREALTLDPTDAVPYHNLCLLYTLALPSAQPQTALSYCQKAIELDPQPDYFSARGVAQALLGNFPAAIADFQVFVQEFEQLNDPTLSIAVEQRKSWIVALKAGENPLTPAVLRELRQE